MLLENKNAVIYGATGAVGAAVASAFAREGARVFLTGRNPYDLNRIAEEIRAVGGAAETAEVDVLDERAVTSHLDGVVDRPQPSISRSTPSGLSKTAYRELP